MLSTCAINRNGSRQGLDSKPSRLPAPNSYSIVIPVQLQPEEDVLFLASMLPLVVISEVDMGILLLVLVSMCYQC